MVRQIPEGTLMHRLSIAFLSAGTFNHIDSYLRFFSARGHDVHWITYTQARDIPGITIHDVSGGVSSDIGRSAKWRYLLAIPRIRSLMRQIRPDILHGHYATAAGTLCLFSGFRPYAISARGTDVVGSMNSPIWRFLLRRVFRKADLVHAVSMPLAELVAKLGVEAHVMVLTQGVDIQRVPYRPASPHEGPLRIICTRYLADVYDPQTILRACNVLKSRGMEFKLTMAGEGPLQESAERLARDLGIGEQVVFLRGFNSCDVASLLHAHDVYLSASKSDGTSICLLEAMACGTFPVISRIAANLDWAEDGRNCLMFNCEDVQGLAETLQRAAQGGEFRQRAVVENRRIVEERADQQRNMAVLEEAYYQLCAEKAGAGRTDCSASHRVSCP
jgi:glycosyltransferase involved in cell wall biosynthesis